MNAAFESKLHHIIGIVINLEVKIGKCPAERIYYVDLLQYIVRLSLLLFTTAALISQLHGWIHPTYYYTHSKFSRENKEGGLGTRGRRGMSTNNNP